jgi:hypothetical protein
MYKFWISCRMRGYFIFFFSFGNSAEIRTLTWLELKKGREKEISKYISTLCKNT